MKFYFDTFTDNMEGKALDCMWIGFFVFLMLENEN